MANEIQANLTVTINDNGNIASGTATFQANFSGTFIGNEQIIGTSAETLQLGDVGSNPVIVFVKNLDSTNFVTVDSANTLDKFPQILQPGQACVLTPTTGTIYAKADTAQCICLVVAG